MRKGRGLPPTFTLFTEHLLKISTIDEKEVEENEEKQKEKGCRQKEEEDEPVVKWKVTKQDAIASPYLHITSLEQD